ncbi:MAG: C39 family peptidase [Patescibacteria group bacterium]
MAKLNVPYVSQISDVKDPHWQSRSCTIANTKMLFLYYEKEIGNTPTLEGLIEEGIAIKAYNQVTGWGHAGIARILRNHGLSAYNEEFRSQAIDLTTGEVKPSSHAEALCTSGIEKVGRSVEEKHPVIISVSPDFGENKEYHTVLVIGVERDAEGKVCGFWYLDPYLLRPRGEEAIFVSLEKFKTHWRRLAIFANIPQ